MLAPLRVDPLSRVSYGAGLIAIRLLFSLQNAPLDILRSQSVWRSRFAIAALVLATTAPVRAQQFEPQFEEFQTREADESLFEGLTPVLEVEEQERGAPLFSRIGSDFKNFYDADTLGPLAASVGLHAVISNTETDEWLRSEYQQNVRNADTDEWSELFHGPKVFGEGLYAIPIYAATTLLARPFDDNPTAQVVGEWGERSLRTILVGGPPVLGLQLLIGASRPMEEHSQSHWEPFQDDNGASGHAFMGAIPFLTAAKMTSHTPTKATLYVASTLPGISRINDDAHYPSQVILGWTLGYLAATAVDDTFQSSDAPLVLPGAVADGNGLNVLWRF